MMPKAFSQRAKFLLIGGLMGACSAQPLVKKLDKDPSSSEELSPTQFSSESHLQDRYSVPLPKNANKKAGGNGNGNGNAKDNSKASEPVAVGGAYLVCMEEKAPQDNYALCRFENEKQEPIDNPSSWELKF